MTKFKKILPWVLIILLLPLPIYFALACPAFVDVSDFGGTYYIAARMVAEGRIFDLYPTLNNYMLYQSAIANYSHQLFNSLPASQIPLFQYPPLLAYLLAPFSYLSAQQAFVVWELLSACALCLSVFLLASLNKLNWIMCLAMSLLYLPVLHTLLTGQIGILVVLLPLSLGYFCLMRGHSLAAGLAWSLLILKMQFLPIAFFLVITLLLAKNWRCAIGFAVGLFVIGLSNVLCSGTQITYQWLQFLAVSDALGINPAYSCSLFLQTSLSRALLQLLPLLWQIQWRMVLYLICAAIALHALFVCAQLVKRTKDYLSAMPYVFVLGIFLMPLISPHLLFYDLSILALAGIVIYGEPRFHTNRNLMRDLLIGWVAVDLYLITAVFLNRLLAQPILVVAILVWLYIRILKARQAW